MVAYQRPELLRHPVTKEKVSRQLRHTQCNIKARALWASSSKGAPNLMFLLIFEHEVPFQWKLLEKALNAIIMLKKHSSE
jgi:hypothetical protein